MEECDEVNEYCENSECVQKGPSCDTNDIFHCFDPDWNGSLDWCYINYADCEGQNKDYVYKSGFSGNCYLFTFLCDENEPGTSISFQGICDEEAQCLDGTDETNCDLPKDKSCLNQLNCFSDCNQLPSCYVGCFSTGTPKGNNKLMELMTCIFSDCGGNLLEDCVNNSSQNSCNYALKDCLEDS